MERKKLINWMISLNMVTVASAGLMIVGAVECGDAMLKATDIYNALNQAIANGDTVKAIEMEAMRVANDIQGCKGLVTSMLASYLSLGTAGIANEIRHKLKKDDEKSL